MEGLNIARGIRGFKKIVEWFHVTLIFALFIPLAFAMGSLTQQGGAAALYVKCLIIAVPVAVTSLASKHVKTLAGYIGICALMLAALAPFLFLRREWKTGDTVYAVGITLEALFIVGKQFHNRLVRTRAEKDNDPFAVNGKSFFESPSLSFVWYFAVMYVLGLGFNSKSMCDLAFFSAIAYFFVVLAYMFLETTGEYIEINKRTKGIPKKRVYGIGGAMILAYAVLILAAIVPSVFMAGFRRYTDIREWFGETGIVPYEVHSGFEFQERGMGAENAMLELMEATEPNPELTKMWNGLFWIICAAAGALVLYAVVMAVRQVFADFRRETDDNGDKVEEIEDEPVYKEEILSLVRKHTDNSEAARIRRQYKRTIRKHRKELPAPSETPTELEKNAGLSDDEEMKALHGRYEEVRYNRLG